MCTCAASAACSLKIILPRISYKLKGETILLLKCTFRLHEKFRPDIYLADYYRYSRKVFTFGAGDDQLDQPCEKLRNITYRQGGKEHPTNNKTKEE